MTRREENNLGWYLEHMASVARWCSEARDEWEERAAILEYEAGRSRKDAENQAFFMIFEKWTTENKKLLGEENENITN